MTGFALASEFSLLPNGIIEKILDCCDDEALKNFCLTSKRHLQFLNLEKNRFKIVKKKVRENLQMLNLSNEFTSLDGIKHFDQIRSDSAHFGISKEGYKHTFRCYDHIRDLNIKPEYSTCRIFFEVICAFVQSKCILFFILSLIAVAFFALSFICLGGANDAYEKYPNGKIVMVKSFSSLRSQLSLSSLQSSPSLRFASLSTDGADVGSEEEEKEEEEEGESERTSEGDVVTTSVMFLWHFTSAAVCFSVFLLSLVLVLIIYFEDENEACFLFLLLFAIPFAILPAIRMDEFVTTTYWVFFVPYLLVAIAFPIVFILTLLFCSPYKNNPYCLVISYASISYILLLAALLLCILRLDNTLPPSFKYTVVFILGAVSVSFGYTPAATTVAHVFTEIEDPNSFDDLGCDSLCYDTCGCDGEPFFCGCYLFFPVMLMFCGFLLPFTLRKDQVFHASYHFTLIPLYVLTFVLLGVFIAMGVKKFQVIYEWYSEVKDDYENYPSRMAQVLVRVFEGTLPIEAVSKDGYRDRPKVALNH